VMEVFSLRPKIRPGESRDRLVKYTIQSA